MWRLAALLLTISLGLSAERARADYRGPIRFDRQTFTNIRPVRFQLTRIPQLTIPRENIRPQPISRETIRPQLIPRETFRRDTFRFSRTIFGYVKDGPDEVPKKGYVPEKLRPPTRRVPLGW